MAYVNKEHTKRVRENLKKAFPQLTDVFFSLTDALSWAFKWWKSPQGHRYWENVSIKYKDFV